jgi:hypothetical protein
MERRLQADDLLFHWSPRHGVLHPARYPAALVSMRRVGDNRACSHRAGASRYPRGVPPAMNRLHLHLDAARLRVRASLPFAGHRLLLVARARAPVTGRGACVCTRKHPSARCGPGCRGGGLFIDGARGELRSCVWSRSAAPRLGSQASAAGEISNSTPRSRRVRTCPAVALALQTS